MCLQVKGTGLQAEWGWPPDKKNWPPGEKGLASRLQKAGLQVKGGWPPG